jgi:hypothetical protein
MSFMDDEAQMDDEVHTVADAIAQAHMNYAVAAGVYGDLSPELLLPIVERVASKLGEPTWIGSEELPLSDALFEPGGQLQGSKSLTQGSPLWNRTFLFIPLVGKLVRRFGLDSAYQIVDTEDLDRLEAQTELLRSLVKYKHFLTVEELAPRAAAFSQFLTQNRDSLLATGYPSAWFTAWPAPLAVNLYPVRVPYNLFNTPRQHRQEEPFVVERSRLIWCCPGTNMAIGTERQCPPGMTECHYELVQLRADVEAGNARRLEDGRQILLDLKIRLVERLVLALRRGSVVGLWDDCLQWLTDALSGNEADFYLKIDQQWGFGLRETGRLSQINFGEMMPGGLTEVLELIGYCEKELTLGTMSRTKAALEPLLDTTERDFDIAFLRSTRRPDIDAALDSFRLQNRQETTFWQDFQERINQALRNDFADEVIVRTRIKRRHAAKFVPRLDFLASWSREALEQTGALPVLQLSPPTPVPSSRFRREGKIWTLAYEGQEAHVPDSKGLQYLAYLLRRPAQPVHVLELVRAADGMPVTVGNIDGASVDALLEEIGASSEGLGDAGPIIDKQAQREILAKIQEFDDEIADAEKRGDDDSAEALKGEKQQLIHYYTGGFGLRGAERRAASPEQRARSSVTKAIGRALNDIESEHPLLREHLASITTGAYCKYEPPGNKPPLWEF